MDETFVAKIKIMSQNCENCTCTCTAIMIVERIFSRYRPHLHLLLYKNLVALLKPLFVPQCKFEMEKLTVTSNNLATLVSMDRYEVQQDLLGQYLDLCDIQFDSPLRKVENSTN